MPFTEEQALVAQTNRAFYDAVQALQISRMEPMWLPADFIKCIHPGWELLTGWERVMDSWRVIFENTVSIQFELADVDVRVLGGYGWVTCVEHISDQTGAIGEALATNLFEQNPDGRWLMVLHHSSPFVPRLS